MQRQLADETVPHLTADQITAYIHRGLGEQERMRVEAHLAICDDCRADSLAARQITSAAAATARPRRRGYIAVAAVAAAVLFVVSRIGPPARNDDAPLRDAVRHDAARAIAVVQPGPGATVESDKVVLVWRATEEGAEYSVTLTAVDGSLLWSGTTRDTSVTVSTLPPGAVFWYVDARRADGQTVSTGVREFISAR